MLGTHDLLAFVAAGIVLNLTPGQDTMYILARTIGQGRVAGVLSVLGISSGCVVHILLAAFGLSAILATSATAFTVVRVAGAAYLVYIGIQTVRSRSGPVELTNGLSPTSRLAIFRQGFLTNLLNPKVALFFLSFLPQFVDTAAGLGPIPFILLGTLFLTTGTVWCFTLVAIASLATKTIRSNQRAAALINRLSGAVYVALGLNLLRANPDPA